MIWIIGDTHFGHFNLIEYQDRPKDFDEIIIRNWNEVVRPDDVVILLGDVIMGLDAENRLSKIMSRLIGKKILVRGNHDVEKKWGTHVGFMERGFDFVCDSFIFGDVAFSHAPLTPLPNQTLENYGKQVRLNVHAHFHKSVHREPKEGEDHKIFKDRYYDYQYYNANREKYKLIQIEDALRPFSLEEIIG